MMTDHNVCRALLRSAREMAREAGIKIPWLSTRAVDGRQMNKRYQICIAGKPGPFMTAHCALDAKTKHILQLMNAQQSHLEQYMKAKKFQKALARNEKTSVLYSAKHQE
jgi:hypothetical protein